MELNACGIPRLGGDPAQGLGKREHGVGSVVAWVFFCFFFVFFALAGARSLYVCPVLENNSGRF
jgi:hypothetical protein